MNHKIISGILYVRHGAKEPHIDEWRELVSDVEKSLKTNGLLRILVKTEGGGPNAAQRNDLNNAIAAKKGTVKVAVMSGSGLVRGVVTAFAWTGKVDIRSFGPDAYVAAMSFLGILEQATLTDVKLVFAELERAVV